MEGYAPQEEVVAARPSIVGGKQGKWSAVSDGTFLDNDDEGSEKQEDRLLIRDYCQIPYQLQSGDMDMKGRSIHARY